MNMKNILDNQLDSSTRISVNEILSDKPDQIHKALYNRALEKFKSKHSLSDSEYKFVEVIDNAKEYYEFSSVLVVSKIYPFTKKTYSLEKYWDNYQFTDSIENVIDESYNYEILEKNYINGTAIVLKKDTGEKIELRFSQLKGIKYHDDWYKYIKGLK